MSTTDDTTTTSTTNLDIAAVTIDCENAAAVGAFWAAALGRELDTNPPGVSEFFARLRPGATPAEPGMMFIKVPEGRTVKNRVHLDLSSSDTTSEVERLVALGASVIHEKEEWGMRWTTLADPEGNEFCIGAHD